ncbi:MAG: tRNA (N(6)-L-threonylcarbamoyladenosine(37)-C(2))-methylthiotransferase MtaB [Parcubacteria group bacterium]|nr:tRNA (N(6)-L-threonylcarbamoyladenosine(37)-C(2))-methylthiotransferase MtaB [Parcubacteria group bacterium]
MSTCFYLHTLGCRLNQAESNKIAEDLLSAGFVFTRDREEADLFIINTCSVTHKADRESRQIARQLKRSNPQAKVIVTGCSQVTDKQIDLYVKNKSEIVTAAVKLLGEPESNNRTHNLFNYNQRTRALVKIQTGCNNFCTYCVVPYLRGKPQSVEVDKVIRDVSLKEKQGFKEVVLTGVNIGKYGRDLAGSQNLAGLLKQILAETNIKRLRLSSINPENITDELIDIFADQRMCQHFHLSLQSGSDSVLARMGRQYVTEDYLDIVKKLSPEYPNFTFTTDIIVGFPGETAAEFVETCDFVKRIGFLKVHIFRYSQREGTKAAEMKNQIDEKAKKERAKILADICRASEGKFKQKMLGQELKVLFEKKVDNYWQGVAGNYLKVQIKNDDDLENKILCVKINEENLLLS